MKKTLIMMCLILSLVWLVSCGKQEVDKQEHITSSNTTTTSNNFDLENLSMWERAGKGIGKILPEPELEYTLPISSDYIVAEIENATYSFFEKYVNQCIDAGFEGSIATAESPDYYFNGETSNGERVQVMYYKEENKCSISAFPAK